MTSRLVTAMPPEKVEVPELVRSIELAVNVVKVPAAAVVPPMMVLSMTPPLMVRASTTSASWIESAGTWMLSVTVRPPTEILVERMVGILEVPVVVTSRVPETVKEAVLISVEVRAGSVDVPAEVTVIFPEDWISPPVRVKP